ncbi:hypothetical protein PC9H_005795 [Pleurotus ostreatus]|uniref:F-box domain-containing protein n=1 Tax=Pleurotus ostreatus TaxID=5322 RepID=A0A8H6ZZP0_PLEOS|nr:uncharacterized protein PC9H_005795 [Pleurotus ostreatus]KAF7433829.1 hypothetical protein PC9H_005795 [Pleurotus ostreatus]
MASLLPPELLTMIFRKVDTKTLHALLFSSATFNTIAEPILYEDVVLRPSNERLPCPIASFLGSLVTGGLYRRKHIKHLSIFADDHWGYHGHLAIVLRVLPNLLSFRLEDEKDVFSFVVDTDRESGRLPGRALTSLRVGWASICPPVDFAWLRPLVNTIRTLSSPYTECAITKYAPILSNITCWELRGDSRSLDEIGRQPLLAAVQSTRVRCIRFIRQSWACSVDLPTQLFNVLPTLQCIELYARDEISDTCWCFYRDGGPAVRVWWLCGPGEEWKTDWQSNVKTN